MSNSTLFSTPPSNASWLRRLGSGDVLKDEENYQLGGSAVGAMREAEAKALKDDGKVSRSEVEAIIHAGQTAGQTAIDEARSKRRVWLLSETAEPLVGAAIRNELRNISVRNAFEPAALQKLRSLEDLSPSSVVASASLGDARFDGVLLGANKSVMPGDTDPVEVTGVRPSNGPIRSTDSFIQVNGIDTTKDKQVADLQKLADKIGGEVIGVHNASKGVTLDIVECINDKLVPSTNPAVHTLSTVMFKLLKAGKTPHVMAHSQGGIITRRALMELSHRLTDELQATITDPIELHKAVQKQMAKIKVETFGGAAREYPDGPQYVHYVNTWDFVASELGLGWGVVDTDAWMIRPGAGAKVLYLRDGVVEGEEKLAGVDLKFLEKAYNRYNFSTHSFDEVYLPARIDFDAARKLVNPVTE